MWTTKIKNNNNKHQNMIIVTRNHSQEDIEKGQRGSDHWQQGRPF